MPLEYQSISVDDRIAMLEARLRSFEADHYGHEVNKLALATVPDSDTGKKKAIEDANAAQATIERAVTAGRSELQKLKAAKAQAGTPQPVPPVAGQQ